MAKLNTQPKTTLADLRRALIANGYIPVPVNGKAPKILGWQKIEADASRIDDDIRTYRDHNNTGILCGQVVAIDIDVPDADAAAHLAAMVLGLPGGEKSLCRIGRAPKATFVFRTEAPRSKAATAVYMLDSHKCQIENTPVSPLLELAPLPEPLPETGPPVQ